MTEAKMIRKLVKEKGRKGLTQTEYNLAVKHGIIRVAKDSFVIFRDEIDLEFLGEIIPKIEQNDGDNVEPSDKVPENLWPKMQWCPMDSCFK